jgi:hypothetical protein
MKVVLALALVVASVANASAQYFSGTGSNPNSHYVQPHVNSNGTVTGGHYQTNPNNTQLDNYGTRGNLNPYTVLAERCVRSRLPNTLLGCGD